MKVAMLGLGKLGLPVSIAMVLYGGHEVRGYDSDASKIAQFRRGTCPYHEPEIDCQLRSALVSGLVLCDSVEEAVKDARIVFVAVPTPSRPDGAFDTGFVKSALSDVGRALYTRTDRVVVSVISTILPGTMRGELAPVLEAESALKIGERIGFTYTAQFIAMGTTVQDFLNPEFVLIGESDADSGLVLSQFYQSLVPKETPICRMSWENAELVKMAYNVYIGFKIVTANTIMEFCHKLESGDCDVVSKTLSFANRRIVGNRYMRGGLGDSGGCHPRDQTALSWLARKLDLSADPFGFVMAARLAQTEWLAELLIAEDLPIVIMGERFKPSTNLTDYSIPLLLKDVLARRGFDCYIYDPLTKPLPPPSGASVFLVALEEPWTRTYPYPVGSVVVDPWRWCDPAVLRNLGVRWVPVGRGAAKKELVEVEPRIQA